MAMRCSKIKLRAGTEAKVREWADALHKREDEVFAALKAEGVTLETVFLDRQADGFYLIYVMQSDDFEMSQEITKLSETAIAIFHRAFKKSCWESVQLLEQLIHFDVNRHPAA